MAETFIKVKMPIEVSKHIFCVLLNRINICVVCGFCCCSRDYNYVSGLGIMRELYSIFGNSVSVLDELSLEKSYSPIAIGFHSCAYTMKGIKLGI